MLTIRHLTISAIPALTLLVSQSAWPEKIEGRFVAKLGCSAYVSSKKLSNPDDARVDVDQTYQVTERNRPADPEFYRIRLETANPGDRWVRAECGEFKPSTRLHGASPPEQPIRPAPRSSGGNCSVPVPDASACETCGGGDSYVLALSWQPAFCETKRNDLSNKPECRTVDPNSYQAANFTLHGLWPNRTACGTHYGFCGSVHGEAALFTRYPSVPLRADTKMALAEVMPSLPAGSGLERHEWHKHGTCTGLLPDEYFSIATDLTRQFNNSGMAVFMGANVGRRISKQALFSQLDRTLGPGTRNLVGIECSRDRNMLVGITLQLPAGIKPGDDLKTLLAQARSGIPRNNCKDGMLIDPIGF